MPALHCTNAHDSRVTLVLGHHVVVGHCQQRRCRLRQRLYAAERGMRQRGARECRYLHSTTPSAARGGRCLLCQQPGAALIARACIRTPDRRRRTPAHTCAHAPSLRPPPAPARTCTWHRQHVCMTTAITLARTNCPPPRCVLGEQTMACRRNQGGVAGVSSWRGTAILCTSLKQSEWTWRCCRS